MKMFSDCSGECFMCMGAGGCLAGHGDDDYCEIPGRDIKEMLETHYHKRFKRKLNQDEIDKLEKRYLVKDDRLYHLRYIHTENDGADKENAVKVSCMNYLSPMPAGRFVSLPWLTGFDWAEAGYDKTANLKLEAKNMDMPKLKPGMLVMHRGGLFTLFGVNREADWCAVPLDLPFTTSRNIPLSEVEAVYERHESPTNHEDGEFVQMTYRRIWQRPKSKYRKILQPEIDRLDRGLCDGTGYENGRAHGIIEGMKKALALLESHDKNREEPPK